MDKSNDQSGADLDAWGGEDTVPLLLPGPGTVCPLQDEDGCCPMGCDACEQFLREWEAGNHEGHEEQEG